ncbi:MAG: hypothetical protein ACXVP3_08540, partial [Actinomycetota bacterium]
PGDQPAGSKQLQIAVIAGEDVTYTATLVPANMDAREASTASGLRSVSGRLRAYRRPPITFTGLIPSGRYRIVVVVAAATNPARTTTLTSKVFAVGAKRVRIGT